jgi:hypothetical protein
VKPPRLVLLAVTGVSLFAFAGCSPVGDAAIKVGGTTYTTKDVDLFTDFQCDYLAKAAAAPDTSGQVQQVSREQARAQIAGYLVATVLDAKVADQAGAKADESQVKTTIDSLVPVIDEVTKNTDERKRLTSLVTSYLESQLALQSAIIAKIGEATLQQLGQEQGTAALQQAAAAARAAIAKKTDIDVDPVYGVGKDGQSAGEDSSLSVPVSTFAKSTRATTASADFLDALPKNQRCG